ncbi:EscU/YscU/HrcU family type III secretion system export apparatus switch protein [Erythrobacter sp. F6033]|uniref:EscU/YscU/HrcU family type III secretion system export apparatus switch protein n=1 Tax=Erythrobacter sp. F6033 TaxID=2926401 RepID=UPI001FF663EC|nr:EscU/YscU/HrcU family type III secretion system export apparatus switch protein [Erythrobacter sp. F6033]MCK0129412.1 EscU/YscU/HrcU family type III secretion system export apparatus switch protein [Erythrobacter sp. F6033]
MSEESTGEKTFEPTEKRKSDAAKKGDVLRSKEVSTAAAMAIGTLMLVMVGPWLFESVRRVAKSSFRFDHGDLQSFTPQAMFGSAAETILPPIFAIGLAVIVMTAGSQLLLGEGRFVPQQLKFKGSRINPLSGLKRMFGMQGLIELGKGILKLVLLGTIAWWWASANIPIVVGLGRGPLEGQLSFAWDAGLTLVGYLVVGLCIIGMVDYPLQRFQRSKRLKMSHKDMRDENKQSEGSPEVKMARRQRQRDLARGGVGAAMKDAQFVIVNPMHFSVALTYDPAIAPAPVVLAKGRGETAMAMREIAAEDGLPVLRYPALARSVYFTTRTNQMVREELYIAVATLVAFVLSLKRGETPELPTIDVPKDLRFDAEGRPQD